MENLSSEDPVFNLWLLLLKLRRVMLRAREKELAPFGVTPEQAGVLYILENSGKAVVPIEISRLMLREPNTVSALLDRMESKGLLRRTRDLGRRNLVRVAITEKGKEAYLQSTNRDIIHNIMCALSEEQRQQLQSYLMTVLEKTLEELTKQYRPISLPPTKHSKV